MFGFAVSGGRNAAVEANRFAVANRNVLSGREVSFGDEEVIVSKTDLKGRITYANKVFIRVSQFTEPELIGAPHSILRHPAMPRCVFALLWQRLEAGKEIFAYVLNRTKHGDGYWVFAHVTPSFDSNGRVTGYHSNRRRPLETAVEKIRPIYAELLRVEEAAGPARAVEAGVAALGETIKKTGMDYDQLVFAL